MRLTASRTAALSCALGIAAYFASSGALMLQAAALALVAFGAFVLALIGGRS